MNATFCTIYVPPVASLKIVGELDIVSRAPLAWRLVDLGELGCPTTYLDLGGVTHVDAGCLRIIDEARRRAQERGARLELSSASACFALISMVAQYSELAAEANRVRARPDRSDGDEPRRVGSVIPGRPAAG